MRPLNIGTEKALQKIKHYCAYQERSHAEVKEKLYGFGLYKNEVETLLAQLVEENYLNEERFAIAFAGGKFRMKSWGKVKIKYELRQKAVSDYCIRKALASIDEAGYNKTLQKLAREKLASLKGERSIFIKKKKLQQYLLQKGFETNLINEIVNII
ncbi:MAG: regulatory protein RecX [Ferruginibacter sp.]